MKSLMTAGNYDWITIQEHGYNMWSIFDQKQFEDEKIDGFGQAFAVPEELDTSMPLTYIVRWAPNSNETSGDVALDFVYGQAAIGTILNGTNTEIVITDVTTTTINSANQIYETRFHFSIPESQPGSGVFIVLKRDAAIGATGDTYGGDIYAINVELSGYFWH